MLSLSLVKRSPDRPLASPVLSSEVSKSRNGEMHTKGYWQLKQRDLIRGLDKCAEVKAGNLDETNRHCVIIKITNVLL